MSVDMVSTETTTPLAFGHCELDFGYVNRDVGASFESRTTPPSLDSLVSTKTTIANVAEYIYTFDSLLMLKDEQVFALFNRNKHHSWPSYVIPEIESKPTTWPSTEEYIDIQWNKLVEKTHIAVDALQPGDMPAGYSTKLRHLVKPVSDTK